MNERQEAILILWDAGLDQRRIAKFLQIKESTLHFSVKCLRKMGLLPPGQARNPTQLIEAVVARTLDGRSQRAISDEFGLTIGRVAGILHRERERNCLLRGFDPRRNQLDPQALSFLRKMRDGGAGYAFK